MDLNNIKIDYNTANIVFPVNIDDEKVSVFLPPVSREEIKSNALVLGQFAELFDEVSQGVLLTDYDVYIDEIIKNIANRKYALNENERNKYINEAKLKMNAILERSLLAGYYLKNNELKTLKDIDIEVKEIIKGTLLFFIVILRYVKPNLTSEKFMRIIKALNIDVTSSTAMEWKNTFMTQSQTKETSEG